MKYRYELSINGGSKGKEIPFAYGSTRTACIRISSRGASVAVEMSKDYSKDMDAGTFDSLQKATDFVSMIEQYQGMTISSPEEIAYHMGWIDDDMLAKSVKRYGKSPYGERLKAVLDGKVVILRNK